MRGLLITIFIVCNITLPACAQSWLEQVITSLDRENVQILLSDYHTDIQLFDQLNEYRLESNHENAVQFDTNGLYTNLKVVVEAFLKDNNPSNPHTSFSSFDNQGAHCKVIYFQDANQSSTLITNLDKAMIAQILHQNVSKSINAWKKDLDLREIILLPGQSAVTAIKILFTFERDDKWVKISGKFASAFAINTLPETIVRSIEIGIKEHK